MTGEAMHQRGAEGARRAKQWLDATTRVNSSWTNEDEVNASKLEFKWPHGNQSYSFDIGGILSGSPFDGQFFVAECKKYGSASDQGTHYDDYTAKCYLTRRDHYRMAHHFMWITWHPFRQGDWTKLCSPEMITKGILVAANRKRLFNVEDKESAIAKIDQDLVNDVASRMWLIVLSDKQEELVISRKDRAMIVAKQIEDGER